MAPAVNSTPPPEFRWRVPPCQLLTVNPKFYPGIFGEFGDVVRARIEKLRNSKNWARREYARFFEWLLNEVDAELYGRIQEIYLRPPFDEFAALKYLDPIVWFEHKLAFAHKLGLHEAPRRRILDLGTGPGHFLLIARFYGHEAVGTEIPEDNVGDLADAAAKLERLRHKLFNSLADVFRIERIRHRVEPFRNLSMLPKGYDLVTAYSVNFDHRTDWGKDAWVFFLDSLYRDVLTETGTVFMTLIKATLVKEQWDYLAARSRAQEQGVVWLTRDALPPKG
jgi:hypothetical protein